MSAASDQITEYLSVGGLFNPEMMNQTQHEAVRDTLIKARDDIQRLERDNAALREQVEELDAKWKMAEDQCFDQVGKIGELKRENAALREQVVIRDAEIDMWASRCAAAIYMLPETVTGGQLKEAQDKFYRMLEKARKEAQP